MADYLEQRRQKAQRKDWFVTILGLVVGIGLVVAGISGIVTSLIAADDYENRTDTLTVDAVIEKLSTSDEKHDAKGMENSILDESDSLWYTKEEKVQDHNAQETAARTKERSLQETMLDIKRKYGKNAILKGMNLEEGATAKKRNQQIGGHQQ